MSNQHNSINFTENKKKHIKTNPVQYATSNSSVFAGNSTPLKTENPLNSFINVALSFSNMADALKENKEAVNYITPITNAFSEAINVMCPDLANKYPNVNTPCEKEKHNANSKSFLCKDSIEKFEVITRKIDELKSLIFDSDGKDYIAKLDKETDEAIYNKLQDKLKAIETFVEDTTIYTSFSEIVNAVKPSAIMTDYAKKQMCNTIFNPKSYLYEQKHYIPDSEYNVIVDEIRMWLEANKELYINTALC